MIKKYFSYYSNNHAPQWLVFAIDTVLITVAFFLSYVISFNFTFNFNLNPFLLQLPIILLMASVSFLFFGTFKSSIRYTGFPDIINLFKSMTLMTILLGLFIIINNKFDIITNFTLSLSTVLIHTLLSFIFLSSSRFVFKLYFNYLKFNNLSSKRVLIYGTRDSSVFVYNALLNNASGKFKVVGFIEGSQTKIRKHINGLSIWTESKINEDFIKIYRIDEIIICSENIDEESSFFKNLKVKITKVQPLQSWVSGDLTLNKSKNIKIEDLLGRAPIKINNTNVVKEFIGETVLITGAAGTIGKELVNQLINFDVKKLILVDQSEGDLNDLQQDLQLRGKHNFTAMVADISDGLRIDMLFQEYKPSIVFHAAEYTNEQLLEKSPYEAIKINISGTKFLADTSSRYNIKKFIFVSNYKALNSTSSIGVTKRLAELYLTCLQNESKTKFITTRYSNIVDSKCSIVSIFEKQIESGESITISHKDVTKFFMTTLEAVELILEAGTMGKGGEIFTFNTGRPINIYDLAKKIIHLSRVYNGVDIKVTGLNPVEKIHEEFMGSIENKTYSYHKKIMIFNTIELNHSKLKSKIEELCFTNRFQHNDVILKMKKLIPESETANSDYDRLYKRVQSYKKAKGIVPEKPNQININ